MLEEKKLLRLTSLIVELEEMIMEKNQSSETANTMVEHEERKMVKNQNINFANSTSKTRTTMIAET